MIIFSTFVDYDESTYKKGDLVISDSLKTAKGMPYIIKVYEESSKIITYFYKGEIGYISSYFVRRANNFDRFCGYIYDRFFK